LNDPLVSVIIPTHNYGDFIATAIESVFAQTYQRIELIIVDDGSTDDTRQVVEPYGARLTYLFQRQSGAAAARNSGILRSSGTYLAFLDADDAWLPCKLERQVALLDAMPEVGVVYTWWSLTDESGKPLPQHVETHLPDGDLLEPLLLSPVTGLPMCMIRRACIDRVGPFDNSLTVSEDWDLLLRLALSGYQFACVPEVLVHVRRHTRHLSSNPLGLECSRRVLAKAFAALPPGPRTESLYAASLGNLLIQHGFERVSAGNLVEASQLLAEGLRLRPGDLARPSFYVSMAQRSLPYGYRTREAIVAQRATVDATLREIMRLLFRSNMTPLEIARAERTAWSTLFLVLGTLHGLGGDITQAMGLLARATMTQPLVPFRALFRAGSGGLGHVRRSLRL